MMPAPGRGGLPVRGERPARGGRCRRVEIGLAPVAQDVWAELRRRGEMSSLDLGARADDARFCADYLGRLVKAGIAERMPGAGVGTPVRVRLVRDLGPLAPKLTIGGAVSRRGAMMAAVWQAIRISGTFTPAGIVHACMEAGVPAAMHAVQSYIRALVRAGYARVTSPGSQHRPGEYTLMPGRNTGLLPPRIVAARLLVDDNTGETVVLEVSRG